MHELTDASLYVKAELSYREIGSVNGICDQSAGEVLRSATHLIVLFDL
jgi:hypothetical protein